MEGVRLTGRVGLRPCVAETHNFVAENVIVHNSNVADAIRWALGENNARVLHAKRNEEPIFLPGPRRDAGSAWREVGFRADKRHAAAADRVHRDRGRPAPVQERRGRLPGQSLRVRLRDLSELACRRAPLGGQPCPSSSARASWTRCSRFGLPTGARSSRRPRGDAAPRTVSVRLAGLAQELASASCGSSTSSARSARGCFLTEQAGKWTEYETVRNDLRDAGASLVPRLIWRDGVAPRGPRGERSRGWTARRAPADVVAGIEAPGVGTEDEPRPPARRRSAGASPRATSGGSRSVRERSRLQASLETIAAERDRVRPAALPGELAAREGRERGRGNAGRRAGRPRVGRRRPAAEEGAYRRPVSPSPRRSSSPGRGAARSCPRGVTRRARRRRARASTDGAARTVGEPSERKARSSASRRRSPPVGARRRLSRTSRASWRRGRRAGRRPSEPSS